MFCIYRCFLQFFCRSFKPVCNKGTSYRRIKPPRVVIYRTIPDSVVPFQFVAKKILLDPEEIPFLDLLPNLYRRVPERIDIRFQINAFPEEYMVFRRGALIVIYALLL